MLPLRCFALAHFQLKVCPDERGWTGGLYSIGRVPVDAQGQRRHYRRDTLLDHRVCSWRCGQWAELYRNHPYLNSAWLCWIHLWQLSFSHPPSHEMFFGGHPRAPAKEGKALPGLSQEHPFNGATPLGQTRGQGGLLYKPGLPLNSVDGDFWVLVNHC